MAGTITVAQDQEWQVSNWAYRSLMDYVLEIVAEDPVVANFVEVCKWNHGLDIPEMQVEEAAIAVPIVRALKTATQGCSDGSLVAKVDGRILDELSQSQFRDATHELAVMLSSLSKTE
jgi:hypothetical protein